MEDKLINNKKFLEILRDKLSRGNNKSIHLNALPGRSATRIDFLELDLIRKNFSKDFINKLLTRKSFKIEITFEDDFDINNLDEKISKRLLVSIRRLKSICKQNNDYFQEHGIKPFAFGFPIICKRDNKDPKNVIKAPLIIWSLEIEEDRKQVNKWTIKREEDYPIYFNDVLISHIEKDEGIKISKIKKEFLDDYILDPNELCEVTSDFINQFGAKNSNSEIQVLLNNYQRCDSIIDQEELIHKIPKINGSGVFGLFINQKQTIIEDYNLFIERDTNPSQSELISENFRINPFAAIDTDPSQQSVVNSLAEKRKIIIHGPPGTGKSQSLTAVISNALTNHSKCLVVCEKRTALDVIYKNLSKIGLQNLVALVEDTSKDRRKIIDTARDTIDDINKTTYKYLDYKFNEVEFSNLIVDTKDTKDAILQYHKSLNQQLFNEDSWTDIVGKYLHKCKNLNLKEFDKLLDPNSFSFDYQEYINLHSTVTKLSFYFKKYNPQLSCLELIEYESLNKIDLIYVYDSISDQIEEYNKLHEDFLTKSIAAISLCKKLTTNDCESHYNSINSQIQYLKDIYNRFGFSSLFRENNYFINFLLTLTSFFSSSLKEIRINKRNFLLGYKKIKVNINEYQYIATHLLDNKQILHLKDILDNLASIEISNEKWFRDLENYVDAKIKSISFNNKTKFENVNNYLIELQAFFTTFINQHTIKALFKTDYGSLASPLTELIETFRNNQNKLNKIHLELSSIHDFIEWKAFYSTLSHKEKIITDAIIQTDIFNGEKYFDSWYLNKILFKNSLKPLSGIDNLIEKITANGELLKSQNIKKILSYWQTRRIDSIFRYNSASDINAKQLFAKTNKSGRKQSLRQIIYEDFELFTDIFPVVMVNPSVCSSIFPLKEDLFDVVVFDEASQLRVEDTFCALVRGKIRIISGDEHQMPPSSFFQANEFYIDSETEEYNEIEDTQNTRRYEDAIIDLAYQESLLDYASQLNYLDVDLQIHYRSRHPLLINFSNAAFYGKKLNPLPERFDFKPIRFINVQGKYNNQVNETEAKQVINILKTNIFRDESGNYPSIGIATFNIHQRNLIIDEINREANSDPDFSDKIDSFYENGMFIKNLENIQGDERDIIIISTTFGKNNDGYFAERFGPLNMSSKGHRLLNVIITRAKFKIFICNSFPEEKIVSYKEHIQQYGNIGRGILYAYLAYAKAIEASNWESMDAILALLAEKSTLRIKGETPLFGTESPFEQEVVDYLIGSGFNSERVILQYACGGFRIDIAIKSRFHNKPIIAIECDGASYHSSNEAYLWDTFRQKQLENYGLKFHRIWSTNWWINPKKELTKLLQFINDVDILDNDKVGYKSTNKNLQDLILNPIPILRKEVKLHSIVKIRSMKSEKEFKIKLVDDPQLKIKHEDTQPVYIKAPLASAMIGKKENESFQIELSGEIYKIIEILD